MCQAYVYRGSTGEALYAKKHISKPRAAELDIISLGFENVLNHINGENHTQTKTVTCRDRIVVSTLRCGRSNPGSNPGHGKPRQKCGFLHC